MPFEIDWYIENEIIFVSSSGVMTLEESRELMTSLNEWVASSPRHLVHIISDVGDIVQTIPLKETVQAVREIDPHPRAGWTIILREKSILVKMSIAVGTSLFKSRTRAFGTLDEAVTFLKQMDDTLSWDKVNESVVPY